MLTAVLSHMSVSLPPCPTHHLKLHHLQQLWGKDHPTASAAVTSSLGVQAWPQQSCQQWDSDSGTLLLEAARLSLAVWWEGGQGGVSAVDSFSKNCVLAFLFEKQICYDRCLRRISMIKVWLLWRLVRNIFSAKPVIDSILVVLEHDEIFSLFSLFTWTFFSLFLPLPPQFYHACRSACYKHILNYIYPECEHAAVHCTSLGVKYVCTHRHVYQRIPQCM